MSEGQIQFKEVQRFRQWWLWIVLVGSFVAVAGPLAFGMAKQIGAGEPWGNRPLSDGALLATAWTTIGIFGAVFLLLFFARLVTVVDDSGLRVRFFPFHFSDQKIAIDQVVEVKTRQYRPLRDYGGWGIRFRRGAKCYNVSGKEGVELTFRNGKKLLIGSQRAQELHAAISALSSM